jgi:hypothetical protein
MRKAFLVLCSAVIALLFAACSHAQLDNSTLHGWGLDVYNEIDETLRVSGTQLYAETASLNGAQSGGFNGRAYVWPAATMFRALNSLTQLEPAAYTATLRGFSEQIYGAYWDAGHRSGAGGGDRFYDDNAHITVALTEAFQLTKDPIYLERAIETHSFVLEGEDLAAGGGIYFRQFDFTSKDTISTLQGARGAALLYRATGEQTYLDDATRLLTWARRNVQLANGLYYQGFNIAANAPAGVEIVNSAGVGISAHLAVYDATGIRSYLTEAQRIANASIPRYFDSATGRINDEGYWAFELVDALNNLYLRDHNPLWLNKVETALEWLHDNKQDPNGHYGVFWGRNGPQVGSLDSWSLNEQASVARAFLYTATMPTDWPALPSPVPGDINQDGLVTATDLDGFRTGWLTDTSALSDLNKMMLGDLNFSGRTDLTDFVLLRRIFNNNRVVIAPETWASIFADVPEPSSLSLAVALVALFSTTRSRNRGSA